MNPYNQKRIWKYLLLVFAVIIAAGSLIYTRYLTQKIAASERTRAEVWALSIQQIFTSDENDFLNYVSAVRDSLSVPAIVTDERGEIITSKGLDTTLTPNKMDAEVSNKKYDPDYFDNQLLTMKNQHSSIKLPLPMSTNSYWLIYYKDSQLLTQLKIFPYVQLTVIAIFLLFAYTAFSSSRKSEQNQVWVGLAKETAHQLGTPISSLMAWVELVKSKFNADNDPLISEMQNDIHRLEVVADRFSKIGSKPVLTPYAVFDVVDAFVNYFRIRVSDKIYFEVTGDAAVRAGLNVPLFDWVLENLLKNAVNAIEAAGTIRVDIGLTGKKQVYIDVHDSGKGIPRSKFETVFQPGYTTRKRGWGLGLSL
ncbi:MAG: sensor histidine kinase, partial [Mucilaginibacter polytrichastri]|nr:sensor histidine kinase [Mucilaginibacter polytrichastri]